VSHCGQKNAAFERVQSRTPASKTGWTGTSPIFRGFREFDAHSDFHRQELVIVGFCLSIFAEPAAMDNEKELIDTFDRLIHRDFPNSQRVGCPGREALLGLAQYSADSELPQLLHHIRQCGACFDELKELRNSRI
jgi:hypothetical protein